MGSILNPTASVSDGHGNNLIMPMVAAISVDPDGGPMSPMTITQTVVPVGTASTPLVAANPSRKYLAWMIIGTADVTIAPGSSVSAVGQGMVYKGLGLNQQGASQEFQSGAVHVGAFACIAAAVGSSVVVWEGV